MTPRRFSLGSAVGRVWSGLLPLTMGGVCLEEQSEKGFTDVERIVELEARIVSSSEMIGPDQFTLSFNEFGF